MDSGFRVGTGVLSGEPQRTCPDLLRGPQARQNGAMFRVFDGETRGISLHPAPQNSKL